MCQDIEDHPAGRALYGHRPVPDRDAQADGGVTIRYKARLHHIGVGRAYKGWRIWLLVDDRDIEIIALDGSPLRRLRLDPTKDYQPTGG